MAKPKKDHQHVNIENILSSDWKKFRLKCIGNETSASAKIRELIKINLDSK